MLSDGAMAFVLAVLPIIGAATGTGHVGGPLDLALVAASTTAFVLLLLRRRYPVPVLILGVLAEVLTMIAPHEVVGLRLVVIVALYTVASTTNRRVAWVAGIATATVLYLVSITAQSNSWFSPESLTMVAWSGMATAAGDAVRSRRAYLAATEKRAEFAERSLEEEARRQVAEERLRIARDLHDIVAHHIALINVQAGVATLFLRDDPDAAEQALAQVRTGSRSVLDELGGILSVLRRPDDPAGPVEPLPRLDQLDQLIESFGAAGLGVDWRTSGAGRPLAPALALAGYRIVQESLTNAHKHGDGGRANLRIDYRPESLTIDVLNTRADPVPHAAKRSGHGIIGMRERVAAAGGTLELGHTDDGQFRVHAVLPVPTETR